VRSSAVASSSSVNTEITCNCVHTFHGGGTQKVLTRSRLVLPPSGELLACAGDEASLAVKQSDVFLLVTFVNVCLTLMLSSVIFVKGDSRLLFLNVVECSAFN